MGTENTLLMIGRVHVDIFSGNPCGNEDCCRKKKNLENQSFVKNVSVSNFPTSSRGGGGEGHNLSAITQWQSSVKRFRYNIDFV